MVMRSIALARRAVGQFWESLFYSSLRMTSLAITLRIFIEGRQLAIDSPTR